MNTPLARPSVLYLQLTGRQLSCWWSSHQGFFFSFLMEWNREMKNPGPYWPSQNKPSHLVCQTVVHTITLPQDSHPIPLMLSHTQCLIRPNQPFSSAPNSSEVPPWSGTNTASVCFVVEYVRQGRTDGTSFCPYSVNLKENKDQNGAKFILHWRNTSCSARPGQSPELDLIWAAHMRKLWHVLWYLDDL